MVVSYNELKQQLKDALVQTGFTESRAEVCAAIFAGNSRDGVHSHGLNRFPTFISYIQKGLINIHAEPSIEQSFGCLEKWDGNLAPGMYTASFAVNRAAEIAQQNGLGCVAVKNTNHWMRGGTYGWQAADKGMIAICGTNAIANMPPWGGVKPTLGNNPLVIAIPREKGHLVLDMAMSQYSYGKLNEYVMKKQQLPLPGGYDQKGELSLDPSKIIATQRTLPVGNWKGSGLSLMMDVLVSVLSGGRTVKDITEQGHETGVSQFFLCIAPGHIDESLVEDIIDYAKSSLPVDQHTSIRYPGEQSLYHRRKSDKDGIEVNEEIFEKLKVISISRKDSKE